MKCSGLAGMANVKEKGKTEAYLQELPDFRSQFQVKVFVEKYQKRMRICER
jgi:hypothetical protein